MNINTRSARLVTASLTMVGGAAFGVGIGAAMADSSESTRTVPAPLVEYAHQNNLRGLSPASLSPVTEPDTSSCTPEGDASDDSSPSNDYNERQPAGRLVRSHQPR